MRLQLIRRQVVCHTPPGGRAALYIYMYIFNVYLGIYIPLYLNTVIYMYAYTSVSLYTYTSTKLCT